MSDKAPVSVEQMCRDLLSVAVESDGSVRRPASRRSSAPSFDPDPQARSAGELVGMANLLAAYLRHENATATAAERERCARAVESWDCACAMACQCPSLAAAILSGGAADAR